MPSGNPLTVALIDCNIQDVETTDQARILYKLNINKLLESLDKIQKDVDMTLFATRKMAVERHSATAGDYVVVSRTHGPPNQDVYQLGWTSPHLAHPVGLHRRD